MSKSYSPRSITLTVALIVAAVGCQEATESVVGPLDVQAHHRPGHGGGGGGADPGAGSVIDLSGAYSTAVSQPVNSRVTGKGAGASSAEYVPITFAVDGLTTAFDAGSCDWTSNLDAAGASTLWTEGAALFASSAARWFRLGVDLKANGEPAGGHFTIAHDRDGQFTYEFKAGTPGDLLGSTHATGTFVDNGATYDLTITGGAVTFLKADCGSDVGCPVNAEQFQVACPNADTFIGTVTPG